MSRNIKEIGKELLGKSLNSYHRKTGLTQLEENNKMQDGILDGILSQVDDAYIEKTEQSNVIHLDGSGDGVVVLDSIEGNTMVNLIDVDNTHGTYIIENTKNTGIIYGKTTILKPNTTYTIMYYIKGTTEVNVTSVSSMFRLDSYNQDGSVINGFFHGFTGKLTTNYQFVKSKFETTNNIGFINLHVRNAYHDYALESNTLTVKDVIILEGDWTNKETPSHFIGLQSSFEENVEEDKYKIEILSNNKNLFKQEIYPRKQSSVITTIVDKNTINIKNTTEVNYAYQFFTFNAESNTTYTFSMDKPIVNKGAYRVMLREVVNGDLYNDNYIVGSTDSLNFTFTTPSSIKDDVKVGICLWCYCYTDSVAGLGDVTFKNIQIEKGSKKSSYVEPKQNKIKLLINEPLRSAYNKKDKLCVKNGKLIIERWLQENIVNGTENWSKTDYNINSNTTDYAHFYSRDAVTNHYNEQKCLSDKFIWEHSFNLKEHNWINNNGYNVCIFKNKANTVNEFKTWLSNNNIKVISVLREPYYEEVLNEYGEPILLEGYENGTIYIDSTIVPTTTVRYTSKMESFKTLKEVENNNIMLTNDVNDNIIPYMMDVDMMILEKEMALMSHKNIRKMEVLDMTSMQKRTQDMLERLIKGKTLTEQECKTRVTTYLNAGKITDTQAEELNFLIDEIYA